MGGVECAPLIRFGFDCFNIAIMPGGGLFTFLFKFHQIGDKKAKEILYYSFYWCSTGAESPSIVSAPATTLPLNAPSQLMIFSRITISSPKQIYADFMIAVYLPLKNRLSSYVDQIFSSQRSFHGQKCRFGHSLHSFLLTGKEQRAS